MCTWPTLDHCIRNLTFSRGGGLKEMGEGNNDPPNFQPLLSLRLMQITKLTGSQGSPVYVARALTASAPCSACRKAAADNHKQWEPQGLSYDTTCSGRDNCLLRAAEQACTKG